MSAIREHLRVKQPELYALLRRLDRYSTPLEERPARQLSHRRAMQLNALSNHVRTAGGQVRALGVKTHPHTSQVGGQL